MLARFSRHYNEHPTIPDQNGAYRTPGTIHSESASELYRLYKAKDYFRLWAYMFVNWYAPERWELWVQSVNPKEIPIPNKH